MGKSTAKKSCKVPQNIQGKASFKSQKQKSKLSNKSKEKKWVDVKIEELDASLAELRGSITVKNKKDVPEATKNSKMVEMNVDNSAHAQDPQNRKE